MNKFILRLCCLLSLASFVPGWLTAQKPTIEIVATAGASHFNSGYQFDWTLGEPLVEFYPKNSHSLGQGFHQSYLILEPPAPENNLFIPNLVVALNDDYCFSATDTITVAGDGFLVVVENGGLLGLVAGRTILLRHGFIVEQGAVFNAWIDKTGAFCENPRSMLSIPVNYADGVTLPEKDINLAFLSVFPNPTNGIITLEFAGERLDAAFIEIFNSLGELIMQESFPASGQHTISLANHSNGLYIIRYRSGEHSSTHKIIKR